jgi:glucosyl-3-phosphoglycerate synthase
MLEISQNIKDITTFQILLKQDRNKIKKSLWSHSRAKRPVLIIPLLASEYMESDNLPVFKNILSHISPIRYLYKIIFGLDRATEEEAFILRDLIKKHRVKNYFIQWNDGSTISDIYASLNEAGFIFLEPGKGKNLFLSVGIALALDALSIGVIDADIRSFDRIQVDRLFYPVVIHDYDFAKAFYNRISDKRLYGRVKRLLLDPLLLSLKLKFSESKDQKISGLIDFLLQFRYQLSGEVAFHSDLIKKLRFATNWGAEIFTLIEVYRKASSAAQVMFSTQPFDHKHQSVSEHDETKGLNRMATDIVTTLINALVQEEGLELSDTFFQELTVIYLNIAEKQIKMHSDEASFNNLQYDRDKEEHLVRNVFSHCILRAGEILTAQSLMTGRFLRVIHTYPEFQSYLKAGLAETIVAVENQMKRAIFETPQTVSWERVYDKFPNIFKELKKAINKENKRFA